MMNKKIIEVDEKVYKELFFTDKPVNIYDSKLIKENYINASLDFFTAFWFMNVINPMDLFFDYWDENSRL